MRLIDADELLKDEHQHYDYLSDEYYVRVKDVESAPTIESEQKKGKWIEPSRNPEFVNKEFFCDCSVCGFTTMDETNFCPHCGAEMKICDDVSDFKPTREDVEKAFDILLDKSKEKEK